MNIASIDSWFSSRIKYQASQTGSSFFVLSSIFMKRTRPIYLAQTQPGFEAIAVQELESRLENIHIRGTRVVADKNGMVLFNYDGDVEDLLELRTIEDVFVL